MIVAIDAGNTRIKWGLHDGVQWVDKGILATADVVLLGEAADEWPADARAVLCNVAGTSVAQSIAEILARRPMHLNTLRSSHAACGVRNGYDNPTQLGADRWAALIGARAQTQAACLVVCAGTATTIDLLDATGLFRGGIILPGFDLMRTSLAQNTAQLPWADGEFRTEARNTKDAIVSGCLHAQVGAVERMYSAIAGEPGAICLITGGNATRLKQYLSNPSDLADNLILDGLVRFGAAL
jgi:type III pantothenate kinase